MVDGDGLYLNLTIEPSVSKNCYHCLEKYEAIRIKCKIYLPHRCTVSQSALERLLSTDL